MFTLALLSGGRSNRMGQDKALMPFLGRPLIQRVLDRLAPMADEVILSANSAADYVFLNLPIVADLDPGAGPLGGLYAVLNAARYPFVAAVACDMPFASRPLFEYELDFIQKTGADIAIPSTSAGLEPLHAVYRREACLSPIRDALESGSYKLIEWMSKVETRLVPPEVVARFDPSGLVFFNLNTPADFSSAEQQARQEGDG